MRFYTKPHPLYCGIDLHARTMYVCMLNHDGDRRASSYAHQSRGPAQDHGTASGAERHGRRMPLHLVLASGPVCTGGHAVCPRACAVHERHPWGKAKNDTSDAKKIAVLLRGGMLPQAYVYPAGATRALLRRRRPRMRKRAELLTHVQPTNCPYNVPEMGKKIAYKATRAGGAERFLTPPCRRAAKSISALLDPRPDSLRRSGVDHGHAGQAA